MTSTLVRMPAGHDLETKSFSPINAQVRGVPAYDVSQDERPAAITAIEQQEHKLAVFIHPWKWLGGQMTDPVLGSLVDTFLRKGYHVLTFNSRGTGRSSGWASLSGSGETQDLHAMVEWGLKQLTPQATHLVLFGYSHGALIASTFQSNLPDIQTSHILLSYPLGYRSLLTFFNSSMYSAALDSLLASFTCNILVIYGDCDEFTWQRKYSGWVKELQEKVEGRFSCRVIEDADHFWRTPRSIAVLQEVVAQWLN